MKKSKYKIFNTNISLLDLFLNLLIGFFFLFVLSYAMINPEQKEGIKTQAEFIITLTWDKDNKNDVDLWVRDPLGNIAYFQRKEVGLIHLDRDDLGEEKDQIRDVSGQIISFPYNQEITTIRGIVSGIWTVNIHLYDVKDTNPSHVEVKIEKINPKVTLVAFEKFILSEKGQEETIANFLVSPTGTVLSVDKIKIQLVGSELMYYRGYSNDLER